jgi:ATP-dependent helicase/nuclease subunit B
VRAQLGLPGTEHRIAQIVDDLSGLLCRSDRVLVTWQALRSGEKNLVSPLFERADLFHRLAWGDGLEARVLAGETSVWQVIDPARAELPPPCERPAPAVAAQRLPERISASAYSSLVACPYQYYGRYVLGLREPDEVREEMEKRDYGEYVHRILRLFHLRFPVCSEVARAQLEQALAGISERIFREATEADYLSHAWAIRWRATIAAYLTWQMEREQQGWRFHAAESKHELEILLPDGATLLLEGRLDRIDEHSDEVGRGYAVIDYKTRSPADLRRSAGEPGEDVQLPVYVLLLAGDVREAAYLSVDNKQARMVAMDQSALEDVEKAMTRLQNIFSRLRAGAPLPAQGVASACQWCELQGLCRKQYWHEDGTTNPAA